MQLQRSIGLIDLTFIAVSAIIGSGWLFAPLLTSQLAGPAAIFSWLIGGGAMLILALCFAEVMGILPVAGGIARIPHFTHGDVTSTVFGWSAWVGYNTAAPIETIAMLEYLAVHFPWLFSGQAGESALTGHGMLVGTGVLVLFMFINALGAKILIRTNTALTWIKLLVPIIVGVAIISTRFDVTNFTASGGFAPYGVEGIFTAVSAGGIIFALIGFRHVIDLAGEVKRPNVTLPLALCLSLLICLGIYLLLQIAFIGALPKEALAQGWSNLHFSHNLGPLASIAVALGIAWVSVTLYAGALIGPFGGGLVAVGSMARLGYALSQNEFFPRFFEKLSTRGVPLYSLLINLVFGILVLIFVPFTEAVAFNGAAITLSFASGPLAVYILRKQLPDASRRFKLPAVTLVAVTGFVVATLIVYWSGWHTTWRLGLVVILGLILFAIGKWSSGVHLKDIDLREALWLIPYGLGLGLISWLGDFGGGLKIITYPWDTLAVALLAAVSFVLAYRCRLTDDKAKHYREEYKTDPETTPADVTPL